jgi:hypothetical protein
MTYKEFVTSAQADRASGEVGRPITVLVDGEEITFEGATESQIALLIAATSATATNITSGIADVINFFFSLLSEEDSRTLRHRLFDRDDPFDVENITDILMYLVEEWSARPTQSPSDSTPSPNSAGQKSTARLRRTG